MANPKLRQTLETGGMVVAPGAYDAMTARLLRHLGFEFIYIAGSQTGTWYGIGEPLTTVTQMADLARRVVRAVDDELPVIMDGNAGYGEPVHVMSSVVVQEDAGVSAIHIEDQFYPKRVAYHAGLEHVVPLDVFQQRLEYARKARRSRDFLIIGRTDGMHATADPWLPEGGGWDEAMRRGHAAVEVGVDALMISSGRDPDELRRICEEFPNTPMLGILGAGPLGVPDYQRFGYQIVIYPMNTLNLTLAAVRDAYLHLLETGSVPTVPIDEASSYQALTDELTGIEELRAAGLLR